MSQINCMKLITVIFRHGERAPIRKHLYPNDPHINETYFPFGEGGLTNKGKEQLYNVGVNIRKRYDEFLGEVYFQDYVKMISSDTPRTKMGAILAGAGMWPPSSKLIWNDKAQWLPIPFSYKPFCEDNLLIGPLERDKMFKMQYEKVKESEFCENLLNEYRDLLDYIDTNAGHKNRSIRNVYFLHETLMSQVGLNLPIPEWSKKIFPKKLNELGSYEYLIQTYTPSMLLKTAGPLITTIISDIEEKINNETNETKVIAYSAHETTIAFLLIVMNLFKNHIPPYASYIVIELLKCNNQNEIKVLYSGYKGVNNFDLEVLTIPGLGDQCSFSDFKSFISDRLNLKL